jgi:hypothetical protein
MWKDFVGFTVSYNTKVKIMGKDQNTTDFMNTTVCVFTMCTKQANSGGV